MPPDEPPSLPEPQERQGPQEPQPPLPPFHAPPEERPLPRGCHPLVFGIVMATIQFAATLYFMPSCFHAPG